MTAFSNTKTVRISDWIYLNIPARLADHFARFLMTKNDGLQLYDKARKSFLAENLVAFNNSVNSVADTE